MMRLAHMVLGLKGADVLEGDTVQEAELPHAATCSSYLAVKGRTADKAYRRMLYQCLWRTEQAC